MGRLLFFVFRKLAYARSIHMRSRSANFRACRRRVAPVCATVRFEREGLWRLQFRIVRSASLRRG